MLRSLTCALAAVLLLSAPAFAVPGMVPLRDAATGRVISLSREDYQPNAGAAKAALSAEAVTAQAREFVARYAAELGISAASGDLVALPAEVDKLGLGHQRFALRHAGLPVVCGEVYVHIDPAVGVYYATVKGMGQALATSTPALTKEQAEEIAVDEWREAHMTVATPDLNGSTLVVLPLGVIHNRVGDEAALLVWEVGMSSAQPLTDEIRYVDASKGGQIETVPRIKHINRRVLDCSKYPGSPGCYIDSPALYYDYWHGRSEAALVRGTDPRVEYPLYYGSLDVDRLHELFGITHNYWLNTFGRNGANNQGGLSKSPATETKGYTHADNPYPASCPGAWYTPSNSTVVFCRGMVTPDVVGHEYAHGITEFSFTDAGGIPIGPYDYGETGALDESFSDLHGESVEKLVQGSNDWRAGSWGGIPAGTYPSSQYGAIRDLQAPWSLVDLNRNPPQSFPAKFSSVDTYCGEQDYQGRHHNSTIPSYAFYLLSEGGEFNGCSISAIGFEVAQQILYRAWTTYFTRTVTFNEAFFALQQAAADLYPQEIVDQVRISLQAVEMDQPGACNSTPTQTPACAGASAVPDDLVAASEGASIRFCGPNPSFGSATIEYALARGGEVEVAVFDVAGRRVALVVAERQERGLHQAQWRDARVPSGHYVVRLSVDGRTAATHKLMVIR